MLSTGQQPQGGGILEKISNPLAPPQLGAYFGAVLLLSHYTTHKSLPGFSFIFSAPLAAWRNLFSACGFFCGGRYQPGCTGIFWSAEGTRQPVTISKKWINPSSALQRKQTWVQALLLYIRNRRAITFIRPWDFHQATWAIHAEETSRKLDRLIYWSIWCALSTKKST